MTNSSNGEGRRNKNFILKNSEILQEYALINQENLGTGIIVINLLLIENDLLKETDLNYEIIPSQEDRQASLKQPIAYIPLTNFWFKMVRLKIKKKYDIDIKKDYDLDKKFLLIFVKDASLESFSIYSVKLK
jgi:hypothetical protein